MKEKRAGRAETLILYIFFLIYIVFCMSMLLFKDTSPIGVVSSGQRAFRNVNLIPLETIKMYLFRKGGISHVIAVCNLLGNIVLFIPMGIYLQLFKKDKRILSSFLIIFAVSLLVEVIQFIFVIGSADIDDILLNCLGGIVGVFLYRLLSSFLGDSKKMRTAVTVCSSLTGIPVLIMFAFWLVGGLRIF